MAGRADVVVGMPVYGTDGQLLGEVAAAGNRTFAQAEPNYRAGFTAAHDERYSGRQFEDAEPELRREYETRSTGTTGRTTGSGDNWEHLREEIRSGWNRARNS